jgi:hypothetical protein
MAAIHYVVYNYHAVGSDDPNMSKQAPSHLIRLQKTTIPNAATMRHTIKAPFTLGASALVHSCFFSFFTLTFFLLYLNLKPKSYTKTLDLNHTPKL